MNYQLYVMAAYAAAFAIISIMFGVSYRRYKKAKQDYLANIAQKQPKI